MRYRLNGFTFRYGLDRDPSKTKPINLKSGFSEHHSFHFFALNEAFPLWSYGASSTQIALFYLDHQYRWQRSLDGTRAF
jgi:hypothetical protein